MNNKNNKRRRGDDIKTESSWLKAFHGKRKDLTVEGGFQTRRSRLKLIARLEAIGRIPADALEPFHCPKRFTLGCPLGLSQTILP